MKLYAKCCWACGAALTILLVIAVTGVGRPTLELSSNAAQVVGPAQSEDVGGTNASTPEPSGQDKTPLSAQAAELLKMAESGVEPVVIKAYVESLQSVKPPTADEIIYLRQKGLPGEIVMAYIHRSQELLAQAAAANPSGPGVAPPPVMPVPPPYPQGEMPVEPFVGPPQTPDASYYPTPGPAYPGYNYNNYNYANGPAYGYGQPGYLSSFWYGYTPVLWYSSIAPRQDRRPLPVGRRPGISNPVTPVGAGTYGPIGSWGGGTPTAHYNIVGTRGAAGGGGLASRPSSFGPIGSWGGGTPAFRFNSLQSRNSPSGTSPVSSGNTR